jgi:hypothetical protein
MTPFKLVIFSTFSDNEVVYNRHTRITQGQVVTNHTKGLPKLRHHKKQKPVKLLREITAVCWDVSMNCIAQSVGKMRSFKVLQNL